MSEDERRQGRGAAIALALTVLPIATGCETMFAAQAQKSYPVEGKLVDVGGGRRIQINCKGEGSPTVIFQSGGDELGSLAWKPVQDRVAVNARTCSYSRAGILWSDPATGPFEPEEVAKDLHAALAAAGEKPPYVLVAHSRGGLYNMIYAGLYRNEIAGLVFADSSHPDLEAKLKEAGLPAGDYVTPSEDLALAFAWTGLMRLSPYPADASIAAEVNAFHPKSAAANAREGHGREKTSEVAGRYRDFENWPVVVLARDLPENTAARRNADQHEAYLLSTDGLDAGVKTRPDEAVWRKLQADLATWSSRGHLEVVPNSNHAFFFFQPDVMVEAINGVLAATRVVRRPAPPPG